MKYISIIEQATSEAIKAFAEKTNLTEHLTESYKHPQEDYLLASENPSVFTVSDGVTLNFKKIIEDKKKYPNPSPAGEVAEIFCKAVVESVRNKYDEFRKEKIEDVFREANNAVGEYNQKVGKSDISGNVTGFYSATGSFVVIKDDKAYWASICDSFFAHFDKDMNAKIISSGLCSPYAVINGEDRMAEYLESGVVDTQEGDRLFVLTDGFENYIKNPDFLNLFKDWAGDLKERVSEFSKEMNLKDPEKYGHERSLIAILI
ncbi:MAG: protein phosphatase 2C domain-containing protein [bacterium]